MGEQLWISLIALWEIMIKKMCNLHLVQERWLKFQYAIIATHNAIKDIHNYLWISIIAALFLIGLQLWISIIELWIFIIEL